MDKMLLGLFQEELLLQCKVLLRAAADLKQAEAALAESAKLDIKTPTPDQTIDEIQAAMAKMRADMQKRSRLQREATDGVWVALQQILVAAANISKLLWGSKGREEVPRTDLRTSIGVDDNSSLRDTDLRNDWEHIDERMTAWYDADSRHIYIGRNIGPAGMIAGDDPKRRFRHYDPSTGEVTFWTHSVKVTDLVQEATAMLHRLEAAQAKRWGIPAIEAPEVLELGVRVDHRKPLSSMTEEELRAIGLDPDLEIRPPGAPPRFPKNGTSAQ